MLQGVAGEVADPVEASLLNTGRLEMLEQPEDRNMLRVVRVAHAVAPVLMPSQGLPVQAEPLDLPVL